MQWQCGINSSFQGLKNCANTPNRTYIYYRIDSKVTVQPELHADNDCINKLYAELASYQYCTSPSNVLDWNSKAVLSKGYIDISHLIVKNDWRRRPEYEEQDNFS